VIAAVDVAYGANGAAAACVLFHDFADAAPAAEHVARVAEVADYEPGAFYKRELPCILAVLQAAGARPEVIVIDGYVWLSADGRPGLGARLFEALGKEAIVIGVAKTPFAGSTFAEEVLRGGSARPLHVTAAGVAPAVAAGWIRAMHGAHRIPTLLKRVDRLCRDAAGG
jgi:deoxyribonuclease V